MSIEVTGGIFELIARGWQIDLSPDKNYEAFQVEVYRTLGNGIKEMFVYPYTNKASLVIAIENICKEIDSRMS